MYYIHMLYMCIYTYIYIYIYIYISKSVPLRSSPTWALGPPARLPARGIHGPHMYIGIIWHLSWHLYIHGPHMYIGIIWPLSCQREAFMGHRSQTPPPVDRYIDIHVFIYIYIYICSCVYIYIYICLCINT